MDNYNKIVILFCIWALLCGWWDYFTTLYLFGFRSYFCLPGLCNRSSRSLFTKPNYYNWRTLILWRHCVCVQSINVTNLSILLGAVPQCLAKTNQPRVVALGGVGRLFILNRERDTHKLMHMRAYRYRPNWLSVTHIQPDKHPCSHACMHIYYFSPMANSKTTTTTTTTKDK